jgi:hypothetical protein
VQEKLVFWSDVSEELLQHAPMLPNFVALGRQIPSWTVPAFTWRTFLQRTRSKQHILTNHPWVAATALSLQSVQRVFYHSMNAFFDCLVQQSASYNGVAAPCICSSKECPAGQDGVIHSPPQITGEFLPRAMRWPWNGLVVGSGFDDDQELGRHSISKDDTGYSSFKHCAACAACAAHVYTLGFAGSG